MPPLPFSWRKNRLGNINKFPKWRILHKARPNWHTYHSSYNSDFRIHKWDNKFWGSYSTCRGFNSCPQRSLLARIINMSPKNGACFDLQENPIFEPQKMNDCFLLPLPNTHIYLWFDMLKAQSLVLVLLLLLSKLDFSKGLIPCEMPCSAAWCRGSLKAIVPLSSLLTYGCVDKIAEWLSL